MSGTPTDGGPPGRHPADGGPPGRHPADGGRPGRQTPDGGRRGRSTPDGGGRGRPTPDGGRPTVLVPVRVLEGETVAQGVVELLAPARVVLLGYHVIPEQTAPDQARLSFEERARAQLADVEEAFVEAGAEVEARLAFTHDREQTFDRVVEEADCDAVMRLNPAPEVADLLVVLHGEVDVANVARVVTGVLAGREIPVTLLGVAGEGPDSEERAETLVERGREKFEAAGHGGQVWGETLTTDDPVGDIASVGTGYDAIAMGARRSTLTDRLLGAFAERVATESLGPVLVVRRPD